jgi:hypothetical protein
MTEYNEGVITAEDYKFVESDNVDNWVVHVTRPPYDGSYITFGKVQVKEDGEDAVLSFEWDVVQSVITESELQEDGIFKNLLGDILTHIIMTSLEEQRAEQRGRIGGPKNDRRHSETDTN